MRRDDRVVEQYRADADLVARWPGWRVIETHDLPNGCNEEIHRTGRLILLDPQGDREWATAHAVAHLDLDHQGPVFTDRQEADADLLAGIWLDVEWDDVPIDGEPTVNLRG